MKKIFVLLFCILFLSSCLWGNTNNNNKKTEAKKVEIEKADENFWVLTKYIKIDITDNESRNLNDIMDERRKELVEIKSMIEESNSENKDEIYEKIIEKRKVISSKISIYIPKEKMQSFTRYNEKVNFMIKNKLDNK